MMTGIQSNFPPVTAQTVSQRAVVAGSAQFPAQPADGITLRFAGMSGAGDEYVESPLSGLKAKVQDFLFPLLNRPRKLTPSEQQFRTLILSDQPDPLKIKGFLANAPKDFNINVRNKADLNKTFLMAAARQGHRAVSEFLLEKMSQPAINAQDKYGDTALHGAASRGHVAVVKLLLNKMSKKAINAQNKFGKTALHVAARNGDEAVAEGLLSKMSDKAINAKNKEGWTALHEAAYLGREAVVELLLNKMSDKAINAQNKEGWTALHVAIRENKEAIAVKLAQRMFPEETQGLSETEMDAFLEGYAKTA